MSAAQTGRASVIGISLAPRSLQDYVQRHGGVVRNGAHGVVRRLAPLRRAGAGDLAPVLSARYVDDAAGAVSRGAFLLVDESLAGRPEVASLPAWFHPQAAFALAAMLDSGDAPADDPVIGEGCKIGRGAVIMPRVKIGARVTIGPGAVIGDAGFGFAAGPDGQTRAIPHLAGVIIEDDVHIGALCTIAAGTLGPTVIKRGAKLDAQVHVGHNCEIGEHSVIAAQSGLAGSVIVGRGVMMGGQVGIADHVEIGDGARIAAKSGVIGDVAPGATVAGYPAVERQRWLRGLAEMYRLAAGRGSVAPSSSRMSPGDHESGRGPASYSSTPPPVSMMPPQVASSMSPPPSSVRPEAVIRRSDGPVKLDKETAGS